MTESLTQCLEEPHTVQSNLCWNSFTYQIKHLGLGQRTQDSQGHVISVSLVCFGLLPLRKSWLSTDTWEFLLLGHFYSLKGFPGFISPWSLIAGKCLATFYAFPNLWKSCQGKPSALTLAFWPEWLCPLCHLGSSSNRTACSLGKHLHRACQPSTQQSCLLLSSLSPRSRPVIGPAIPSGVTAYHAQAPEQQDRIGYMLLNPIPGGYLPSRVFQVTLNYLRFEGPKLS